MDADKMERLLAMLEDVDLILKRMQLMCAQMEKEIKVKMNDRWEIIEH